MPEIPPERRRNPRLSVSAPINFRRLLSPQESFSGSLGRDLSVGGARVTAPHFLPQGTRLVVLLSLPGVSHPIRTIARVAWVARRRAMEAYDCGVRFIEVTSEDRRTLADYVERGMFIRG